MGKKRIRSRLYIESKIKIVQGELIVECDPEGFLFANGRYRTKILPEDLPEWFVYGYLYKRHGYISAKGVKHLLYVPDYTFNHLHKDDMLFISYDAKIEQLIYEDGFPWYQGYKYVIGGSLIADFVEAAQSHSGYNIDEIQSELMRKRKWFDQRNPPKGELLDEDVLAVSKRLLAKNKEVYQELSK